MKKIVSLLVFCILPLRASEMHEKLSPSSEQTTEQQEQMFEYYKKHLSPDLKAFLENFKTWDQKDKEKIQIHGMSFFIKGLSAEKQAPYNGNIGFWIDMRTQTQEQRVCLINCLYHLRK